MKPESKFITKVNRGLDPGIYTWKTSDRYTLGIPDVWYRGNKASLWVEYKVVWLPIRATTLVRAELSQGQIDWLQDRKAQGENVAVCTGVRGDDRARWIWDGFQEARDGVTLEEFKSNLISIEDVRRIIEETVNDEIHDSNGILDGRP